MPPLTTPRSSRGAKLKALQSIKVIAEKTIEFNRTISQQPSFDTDVDFEPSRAQRRSLRLASQSEGGSPDTAIAIDSDEDIEPPKKLKAFCVGDAARVAVNKRFDKHYARTGRTRPQSRQTSQQPLFDSADGVETPELVEADFDFGGNFAEAATKASASAVEFVPALGACSEQEATSASATDLVAVYALDTCSEEADASTSASAAAFVSALIVDACPRLEADSDPSITSASESSSAPATPLTTQSETLPTTNNAPPSSSSPSHQLSTNLASTPEVQCIDESSLMLLQAVMAVQAEAKLEQALSLHIDKFGSPLDAILGDVLKTYPALGPPAMAIVSFPSRSRSVATSGMNLRGQGSLQSRASSAPPSTATSFVPPDILPSSSPTAFTDSSRHVSDPHASTPMHSIQNASTSRYCETAIVMHTPLDNHRPALGGS